MDRKPLDTSDTGAKLSLAKDILTAALSKGKRRPAAQAAAPSAAGSSGRYSRSPPAANVRLTDPRSSGARPSAAIPSGGPGLRYSGTGSPRPSAAFGAPMPAAPTGARHRPQQGNRQASPLDRRRSPLHSVSPEALRRAMKPPSPHKAQRPEPLCSSAPLRTARSAQRQSTPLQGQAYHRASSAESATAAFDRGPHQRSSEPGPSAASPSGRSHMRSTPTRPPLSRTHSDRTHGGAPPQHTPRPGPQHLPGRAHSSSPQKATGSSPSSQHHQAAAVSPFQRTSSLTEQQQQGRALAATNEERAGSRSPFSSQQRSYYERKEASAHSRDSRRSTPTAGPKSVGGAIPQRPFCASSPGGRIVPMPGRDVSPFDNGAAVDHHRRSSHPHLHAHQSHQQQTTQQQVVVSGGDRPTRVCSNRAAPKTQEDRESKLSHVEGVKARGEDVSAQPSASAASGSSSRQHLPQRNRETRYGAPDRHGTPRRHLAEPCHSSPVTRGRPSSALRMTPVWSHNKGGETPIQRHDIDTSAFDEEELVAQPAGARTLDVRSISPHREECPAPSVFERLSERRHSSAQQKDDKKNPRPGSPPLSSLGRSATSPQGSREAIGAAWSTAPFQRTISDRHKQQREGKHSTGTHSMGSSVSSCPQLVPGRSPLPHEDVHATFHARCAESRQHGVSAPEPQQTAVAEESAEWGYEPPRLRSGTSPPLTPLRGGDDQGAPPPHPDHSSPGSSSSVSLVVDPADFTDDEDRADRPTDRDVTSNNVPSRPGSSRDALVPHLDASVPALDRQRLLARHSDPSTVTDVTADTGRSPTNDDTPHATETYHSPVTPRGRLDSMPSPIDTTVPQMPATMSTHGQAPDGRTASDDPKVSEHQDVKRAAKSSEHDQPPEAAGLLRAFTSPLRGSAVKPLMSPAMESASSASSPPSSLPSPHIGATTQDGASTLGSFSSTREHPHAQHIVSLLPGSHRDLLAMASVELSASGADARQLSCTLEPQPSRGGFSNRCTASTAAAVESIEREGEDRATSAPTERTDTAPMPLPIDEPSKSSAVSGDDPVLEVRLASLTEPPAMPVALEQDGQQDVPRQDDEVLDAQSAGAQSTNAHQQQGGSDEGAVAQATPNSRVQTPTRIGDRLRQTLLKNQRALAQSPFATPQRQGTTSPPHRGAESTQRNSVVPASVEKSNHAAETATKADEEEPVRSPGQGSREAAPRSRLPERQQHVVNAMDVSISASSSIVDPPVTPRRYCAATADRAATGLLAGTSTSTAGEVKSHLSRRDQSPIARLTPASSSSPRVVSPRIRTTLASTTTDKLGMPKKDDSRKEATSSLYDQVLAEMRRRSPSNRCPSPSDILTPRRDRTVDPPTTSVADTTPASNRRRVKAPWAAEIPSALGSLASVPALSFGKSPSDARGGEKSSSGDVNADEANQSPPLTARRLAEQNRAISERLQVRRAELEARRSRGLSSKLQHTDTDHASGVVAASAVGEVVGVKTPAEIISLMDGSPLHEVSAISTAPSGSAVDVSTEVLDKIGAALGDAPPTSEARHLNPPHEDRIKTEDTVMALPKVEVSPPETTTMAAPPATLDQPLHHSLLGAASPASGASGGRGREGHSSVVYDGPSDRLKSIAPFSFASASTSVPSTPAQGPLSPPFDAKSLRSTSALTSVVPTPTGHTWRRRHNTASSATSTSAGGHRTSVEEKPSRSSVMPLNKPPEDLEDAETVLTSALTGSIGRGSPQASLLATPMHSPARGGFGGRGRSPPIQAAVPIAGLGAVTCASTTRSESPPVRLSSAVGGDPATLLNTSAPARAYASPMHPYHQATRTALGLAAAAQRVGVRFGAATSAHSPSAPEEIVVSSTGEGYRRYLSPHTRSLENTDISKRLGSATVAAMRPRQLGTREASPWHRRDLVSSAQATPRRAGSTTSNSAAVSPNQSQNVITPPASTTPVKGSSSMMFRSSPLQRTPPPKQLASSTPERSRVNVMGRASQQHHVQFESRMGQQDLSPASIRQTAATLRRPGAARAVTSNSPSSGRSPAFSMGTPRGTRGIQGTSATPVRATAVAARLSADNHDYHSPQSSPRPSNTRAPERAPAGRTTLLGGATRTLDDDDEDDRSMGYTPRGPSRAGTAAPSKSPSQQRPSGRLSVGRPSTNADGLHSPEAVRRGSAPFSTNPTFADSDEPSVKSPRLHREQRSEETTVADGGERRSEPLVSDDEPAVAPRPRRPRGARSGRGERRASLTPPSANLRRPSNTSERSASTISGQASPTGFRSPPGGFRSRDGSFLSVDGRLPMAAHGGLVGPSADDHREEQNDRQNHVVSPRQLGSPGSNHHVSGPGSPRGHQQSGRSVSPGGGRTGSPSLQEVRRAWRGTELGARLEEEQRGLFEARPATIAETQARRSQEQPAEYWEEY